MSLTHIEILQDTETRLLEALVAGDYKAFKKMLHPDIVFTDEAGQSYNGIDKIPYLNPEILRVTSCKIVARTITFFTNVAVVNAMELRVGYYRGIYFERKVRVTRNWKFSGRCWQVISAGLVCMPENENPCQ